MYWLNTWINVGILLVSRWWRVLEISRWLDPFFGSFPPQYCGPGMRGKSTYRHTLGSSSPELQFCLSLSRQLMKEAPSWIKLLCCMLADISTFNLKILSQMLIVANVLYICWQVDLDDKMNLKRVFHKPSKVETNCPELVT